jgi:hypothetical protein
MVFGDTCAFGAMAVGIMTLSIAPQIGRNISMKTSGITTLIITKVIETIAKNENPHCAT